MKRIPSWLPTCFIFLWTSLCIEHGGALLCSVDNISGDTGSACETSGKCFLHITPAMSMSRGCAVGPPWPRPDLRVDGCWLQRATPSEHIELWCFCSRDYCNTEIYKVVSDAVAAAAASGEEFHPLLPHLDRGNIGFIFNFNSPGGQQSPEGQQSPGGVQQTQATSGGLGGAGQSPGGGDEPLDGGGRRTTFASLPIDSLVRDAGDDAGRGATVDQLQQLVSLLKMLNLPQFSQLAADDTISTSSLLRLAFGGSGLTINNGELPGTTTTSTTTAPLVTVEGGGTFPPQGQGQGQGRLSVNSLNGANVASEAEAKSRMIHVSSCGSIYKVQDLKFVPQLANLNVECPDDFEYIHRLKGCYRLMTSQLNHTEAEDACQQEHERSHLITMETFTEHQCISNRVTAYEQSTGKPRIWQGWWTRGVYNEATEEFAWDVQDGDVISRLDPRWLADLILFPYRLTCVWLIPNARLRLGNYGCNQMARFICEIPQ